jgi:hypothetical protein
VNKILELIAKYGGASGLIAAFAVYVACANGVDRAKESNQQNYNLLEYRLLTLETQQKESAAQYGEIQKALMTINVSISRIETLLEKPHKN